MIAHQLSSCKSLSCLLVLSAFNFGSLLPLAAQENTVVEPGTSAAPAQKGVLFDPADKPPRVVAKQSQETFSKERRSIDNIYIDYVQKLNDQYLTRLGALRNQVVDHLEIARDRAAKRIDLEGANVLQLEIDSFRSLTLDLPALPSPNKQPRLVRQARNAPDTPRESPTNSELDPTSLLAQVPYGVPADAVRLNGHSYKFFPKGFPFSAAARICQQMGGHLVSVESQEELVFIARFAEVNPYKCDQFWVNATDDLKEGEWRTFEGQRLTYLPWGQNEPSNTAGDGGQEHYASISRSTHWQLNDTQGVYRSYGYICEWDK